MSGSGQVTGVRHSPHLHNTGLRRTSGDRSASLWVGVLVVRGLAFVNGDFGLRPIQRATLSS